MFTIISVLLTACNAVLCMLSLALASYVAVYSDTLAMLFLAACAGAMAVMSVDVMRDDR